MSLSLSSIPAVMLKDKSYPAGLLKGTPARGCFFPSDHLPPFLDFLPGTPSLLHPLKSLGRLVSGTHQGALHQLPLPGPAPPFFGHSVHGGSVLREHVLRSPGYLSHMLPGHVHPKPAELEAGAAPGFLSPASDRSSSSSSCASSSSLTPPKDSLFVSRNADFAADKRGKSYNFSEDDLLTVLYGYSGGQRSSSAGHSISGVLLPEHPVSDSRVFPLDKETLELPEGLTIIQAAWGNASQCGVFTDKNNIPKGTRFGPFQGKLVNTSEIKTYDDNTLMWEVFENGRLSHFVDGRGSGNWMCLVKCARFPEEQNLIATQMQGQIFYEACKEISPGQELLVWYGDCYIQFLGIPLTLKDPREDNRTVPPTEDTGEGFKCDRCGKVFAYKYYRDKHLKYTRCVDQGDRKFPCHLCNRSFEKRDRLRIHILHVHEKHRPHKCSVCGKSFSQSSSLNKHMRVHSGERPYKCVYCNKAFTASSILRTHIRQHSGERPFKCKHCGKAFASHAAHDSHVRRTHARDQPQTCNLCGASFQDEMELKSHKKSHQKSPTLDSTVLSSPRLEESVYPGKESPEIPKNSPKNFPYPGFTVSNPEYRPWN